MQTRKLQDQRKQVEKNEKWRDYLKTNDTLAHINKMGNKNMRVQKNK